MESISSTVMRNICTSQLWDIARAYFSLPSLDFLLWSVSGLTLFAEPPEGCVTQGQQVSCSLSKYPIPWEVSGAGYCLCRVLVLPLGCCPWVAALCHPVQEFMVSAVHRRTSGVPWPLHAYSASTCILYGLGLDLYL